MKKKRKGYYPQPTRAQLTVRAALLFLVTLCLFETVSCSLLVGFLRETAPKPGDPKWHPKDESIGWGFILIGVFLFPLVATLALPATYFTNKFYEWLGEQFRIVDPEPKRDKQ